MRAIKCEVFHAWYLKRKFGKRRHTSKDETIGNSISNFKEKCWHPFQHNFNQIPFLLSLILNDISKLFNGTSMSIIFMLSCTIGESKYISVNEDKRIDYVDVHRIEYSSFYVPVSITN